MRPNPDPIVVHDIFLEAVELDTGSCDRFLTAACRGDANLEAEVRFLLTAHQRAGGFLTDPTIDPLKVLSIKGSPVGAADLRKDTAGNQ